MRTAFCRGVEGAAPYSGCYLPDKLKFDYGSNDTEQSEQVTITAAPATNCHRALRSKPKFGGIMIDEPGKKMV